MQPITYNALVLGNLGNLSLDYIFAADSIGVSSSTVT